MASFPGRIHVAFPPSSELALFASAFFCSLNVCVDYSSHQLHLCDHSWNLSEACKVGGGLHEQGINEFALSFLESPGTLHEVAQGLRNTGEPHADNLATWWRDSQRLFLSQERQEDGRRRHRQI